MTVSEQFVSLLIMTLSGILIGAVIDSIRTFINELSPKSFLRKFAIGVELIVWALLGAGTFYILFLVKGGEWRLIDPLAQISGILLYESVFQPFFRLIGKIIVIVLFNPLFGLLRLLYMMMYRLVRLLLGIIALLLLPFQKIFIKIKKVF